MANDNAGGGARGLRCENTLGLQRFLREEYGLDSASEFSDIGGGNNLILSAQKGGRRCVARIYRPWVSAERLRGINAVIARIKSEVPVAEKILAADNRPFCQWNGLMVELEWHVEHDGYMDSPESLEVSLEKLARFHSLIEDMPHGGDVGKTIFTNSIGENDFFAATNEACARIRSWANLSDYEKQVAGCAQELAEKLSALKFNLPVQLTHGDFWHNNLFFQGNELVSVCDFDFLGARPRADDLALTFYFADAKFMLFDPYAGDRLKMYRRIFARYDAALDSPWSDAEKAAMPYIMARQPLWGIGGWARTLDDEMTAREYIGDMLWYVKWGLSMIDSADEWRERVFS